MQMTNQLSDKQQSKLTTLLEKVENATNPEEAVWVPEDDREELREIRKTIEE